MTKILILKNEELFNALEQMAACKFKNCILQHSDIEHESPVDADVVIGNSHDLSKINHRTAHFICLADENENIKHNNMLLGIKLIKKPYGLSEIVNEINGAISNNDLRNEVIKIGNFAFDNVARILERNGALVTLTEKESELICLLHQANGEVISRDEILKKVWGYEESVETHTVETHIYRIRQKLGKDNDFIGNLGSGYFIKENA